MTWLNTNTLHNVLNVVIAVLAMALVFDYSVFGWAPATIATITGVLATSKTVINIVRDGLGGLVQPQPPVGTPPVV